MNESSVLRPTLLRAMKISWNYKFLWFFGIFTALVGGSGEFQAIARSFDGLSLYQRILIALKNGEATGTLKNIWNLILDIATTQTFQVVFWAIVLLILTIMVVMIIIVSQTALVDSTARVLENEPISLDTAWLAGMTHFWRMFAITVIGKVIVVVMYLALTIPLGIGFYSTQGAAWNIALVLLSVFVFLPLAVILNFVVRYAQSYTVIEHQPMSLSFLSAWKLFRQHWIASLEMAVAILLASIIAYLLLVLGVALVAIPFLGVSFILSLFNFDAIAAIIANAGIAAAIIWIALAGSVTSVFQWSAWVTFFMEIQKGTVRSHLAQFVDRLPLLFQKKRSSVES
ncbi:MAG: hypothetical protein HYZ08_01880 [Candidatus Kerfeldbacteria bacterium]|nr:hypothetical protein [Candidatus Kerfeldbacteria bacterium]